MHKVFVKRLNIAREWAGVKFVLNSAWRCAQYQNLLREHDYQTAEGVSPHEKGLAVDIRCTNETRYAILKSLMDAGFTRFGFGRSFIHVDMDMERKQKHAWYYLH